MTINAALYYTQSVNSSGKPQFDDLKLGSGKIPAYSFLVNENGEPLKITKDYRQTYIDTAGQGKLLDWNYYPLEDYKHDRATSTLNNLGIAASVNYKIIRPLSIDAKFQYDRQSRDGRSLRDLESYSTRNTINLFSQLNRTTGVVTYKVPMGEILDLSTVQTISKKFRTQLNFDTRFKNHQLTAIAGLEINDVSASSNNYRTYGYNAGIATGSNVDYVNTYPSFVSGSNSVIFNNADFGASFSRYVSAYANTAYTFRNRYTASLSLRRDASNSFGVNTNDKWNMLWSSGLSWYISKEKFFTIPLLSDLKLRCTYGTSGNVDPSMTALTTIFYSVNSIYTQTPTAIFDKFANPELRWEKISMFNLGLDFKIKNNRVEGSIEYYHKKGTDLYGTDPVDYTAVPANNLIKNIAAIKGNGIDIELNTINIDRKIKWTTQLNFNVTKDKVTAYYSASLQASGFVNSNAYAGIVGRPVYSIFSYHWAGLDPLTGDPSGFLDGQVSKDYANMLKTPVADVKYEGPRLSPVFGSVGNTISWKGWHLTARCTYKFGYYFFRDALRYAQLYNALNGHREFAARWQKPGDELITNVPSMSYPAVTNRDAFYAGSEVNVLKGDHIRLQYINLAFDVPAYIVKKMRLQNMQLYAVMNNIGILWRANKEGIDPDYKTTSIPPSRSMSLGLRFTL